MSKVKLIHVPRIAVPVCFEQAFVGDAWDVPTLTALSGLRRNLSDLLRCESVTPVTLERAIEYAVAFQMDFAAPYMRLGRSPQRSLPLFAWHGVFVPADVYAHLCPRYEMVMVIWVVITVCYELRKQAKSAVEIAERCASAGAALVFVRDELLPKWAQAPRASDTPIELLKQTYAPMFLFFQLVTGMMMRGVLKTPEEHWRVGEVYGEIRRLWEMETMSVVPGPDQMDVFVVEMLDYKKKALMLQDERNEWNWATKAHHWEKLRKESLLLHSVKTERARTLVDTIQNLAEQASKNKFTASNGVVDEAARIASDVQLVHLTRPYASFSLARVVAEGSTEAAFAELDDAA